MVQTEDQYLFIWIALKFGLEKPKEPDYSAFKDFALSYDQNARYRPTMEDEHVMVDEFGDVSSQAYFGLYDGHGGKDVAVYVAEHLHQQLAMTMPNSHTMKDAFMDTYKIINEGIQTTSSFNKQGCTSVSVFLSKQGQSRLLDVANAGDANAILCRAKEALILTKEHKGSSQAEAMRIQQRGGWVVNGKVAGVLSVTRAFGDVELKDFIDAEPHTTSVVLGPHDTHLIVACDGLWDVMTPQEAVDMIQNNKNSSAEDLSNMLVQEALKKGTRDNISVMIVVL
jgi:serine/threonine protein phosphatase PrpC